MNKEIIYLSKQEVIEFNILALNLIKIKKADKSDVLSYLKIHNIIDGCQQTNGDVYDKAVYLLKNTIKPTRIPVK